MPEFPRITVVTPSFNQASYLERTILSILDQEYPNLEYIIVDGGSTDGSVEIIHRYADKLSWWVSEADDGQSAAINKGLQRATGEWVAWQNSDDIYYPGTFKELAASAAKSPEAELIIGDIMLIDENDIPLRDIRFIKPNYNAMIAEGMILANQAAFWRRQLHDKLGFLSEDLHYSFDYEWFLRLTEVGNSVHCGKLWGAFRLHRDTKTSNQGQAFTEETQLILAGRQMPSWRKQFYKVRRLLLLLQHGHLYYALRGILRRLANRYGRNS